MTFPLLGNDATPPTPYTQLPKFLMFNCQRAGQVGPAPHPERCHNRNEKNN